MSVAGSLLLPTTSLSARSTTRSTKRSTSSGAAYTRWTDRQFWPAAPNAPSTTAWAARSTSASGRTMTAPLPPSSISVFLAPAAARHRVPRGVPAGERHHVDERVTHQGSPHGGTAAGEHREPTSRHSGLQKELDEGECGQRRLLGGLEHDAVPTDQGRGQLVRDEVERVVVGRDRTDDPDRLARVPADAASSTRSVAEGEGAALEAMGLLGRQANGLDGSHAPRGRRRAPACSLRGRSGSRRARCVPPGEPRPGSTPHGAARAARRPLQDGPGHRPHGHVDVCGGAVRDRADHGSVLGVSHVEPYGRWSPRAAPEGSAGRRPRLCRELASCHQL